MPSKETNRNGKDHLTKSWIDDLPVCTKSGIGMTANGIYRADGTQYIRHVVEDRSFYCQVDKSTHLYGVFDGYLGTRAVDFVLQRMPAEILLGQLIEKKTDEEIKDILRQAYTAVEKGYMDSLGDLLAERTGLQCEIPDGLAAFEAYQKYPEIFEKLKSINNELSSGTSAVICLVYNDKLYVANVGNSRALLCKTDANAVLRVVQLSVDHDLRNEDELLRLSQLGITPTGLQIGNQETTRCLGNYLVKGGYKEFRELQCAFSEPVIAEPEIHGGIHTDESCRFLLLMSAGLYKALEKVIPVHQVNKYIAQLVVEQFRSQTTLNQVAQAVVDKTVHLYHNNSSSVTSNSSTGCHEDITLVIRNFNFPLIQNNNNNTSVVVDTSSSSSSSSSTASVLRVQPYVDFSVYYANIHRLQDI